MTENDHIRDAALNAGIAARLALSDLMNAAAYGQPISIAAAAKLLRIAADTLDAALANASQVTA